MKSDTIRCLLLMLRQHSASQFNTHTFGQQETKVHNILKSSHPLTKTYSNTHTHATFCIADDNFACYCTIVPMPHSYLRFLDSSYHITLFHKATSEVFKENRMHGSLLIPLEYTITQTKAWCQCARLQAGNFQLLNMFAPYLLRIHLIWIIWEVKTNSHNFFRSSKEKLYEYSMGTIECNCIAEN